MAEADQQQQSLRAPPISVQPPSPFLQFSGNPPVEWSRWYHAFETYLLAAGLDALPDRRKKALLEQCLGTEGQRVLATLDVPQQQPANDEQQPTEAQQYQRIVSELTAHFGTQATVITERHRFRQRSQAAGETIKQYVSALRQLAARCQFGVLHDQMIHDQLIEKTASSAIRERLLLEKDDLLCMKALEIACQVESAKQEAMQMGGTSSASAQPTTSDIQRVAQKPKQQKQTPRLPRYGRSASQSSTQLAESSPYCGNCSMSGHKLGSSSCPAKGKECFRCHKLNHFGRCCRSSKNFSGSSKVRSIINIPTCQQTGFKLCSFVVAGHNLSFIVDLGAKVSIINQETWRRLFPNYKLQTTSTQLTGYDGKPIKALGTVSLSVQHEDQPASQFQFFATTNGSNLMGVNLFDHLGFSIATQHQVPVLALGVAENTRRWPSLFLDRELRVLDGYALERRMDP